MRIRIICLQSPARIVRGHVSMPEVVSDLYPDYEIVCVMRLIPLEYSPTLRIQLPVCLMGDSLTRVARTIIASPKIRRAFALQGNVE